MKEYPHCSVCVWCWEGLDRPIYCRLGMDQDKCQGPISQGQKKEERMRYTILWVVITILFGVAMGEFGFIMGVNKGQAFYHEGKLLQHETKIQILRSEMKEVRDKLRIP